MKIICKSCGHVGNSVTVLKGSGFITFLLLCCAIVPGLIYMVWRRTGPLASCLKCKSNEVIPEDSALGMQLKATQVTTETHVKCPECRELVLSDALKCKHCGCKLIPAALTTRPQDKMSVSTKGGSIKGTAKLFKVVAIGVVALVVIGQVGTWYQSWQVDRSIKKVSLAIDAGSSAKALEILATIDDKTIQSDERFSQLRLKAKLDILKKECTDIEAPSIGTLLIQKNDAALTKLASKCGRFLPTLAQTLRDYFEESARSQLQELHVLLPTGQVMKYLEIESIVKNRFPAAIVKANTAFIIPIGQDHYVLATIPVDSRPGENQIASIQKHTPLSITNFETSAFYSKYRLKEKSQWALKSGGTNFSYRFFNPTGSDRVISVELSSAPNDIAKVSAMFYGGAVSRPADMSYIPNGFLADLVQSTFREIRSEQIIAIVTDAQNRNYADGSNTMPRFAAGWASIYAGRTGADLIVGIER